MSKNWNRIKVFRKKVSWSLAGNLIYAISQWGIISIIARYGSAEDLGIYSLGLAVTAPIILFFNFQLRVILATDTNEEFNFPKYLGGRIVHLTLAYIIIICISLLYSKDTITLFVILLIGLVKYVESLSDICMGYFQRKSRIDLIGRSQFFRGLFSMLFFGVFYILTKSIVISILILLIVMVLRLIFYDFRNLSRFTLYKPIFDQNAIKQIKWFFPLGLTSLISSLNTNIPRYFLDHYTSVADVGVFSALYYILVASNMLISPISLLAAPRIAKTLKSKTVRPFIKINIQLFLIAILGSLLIVVPIFIRGDLILTLLYGGEYALYQDTFLIISSTLVFGFLVAFLNISVIAARAIRIQPIINTVTVIVTIVAGFLLIKSFGIYGAAWTLFISRLTQTFLYIILFVYIVINKISKEKTMR
ncbi:oligosaccharide flippase family protein [Sporosarcina sp. FSL W8-0480]|uniref:lipopolysaccharide biosynthesis protein n=1 Tax=Sporosarcina sp. FSL W8-0480 TaxID=2954701 RepID=UPI0030D93C28